MISNTEIDTLENISRRDFIKMKFFLMIYTYFYQFFGTNIFADTNMSKIDYSILDKLMKIPFSKEVKDEINLRVKLQKQYCYDANGSLHSLNRFFKETINFVISKKDFKNFKLLNTIKDPQMDYSYMLNCSAKHNELKSMKFIQKKLLGTNTNMLNEAIEYAIKSQSFETTSHLMKQKIKLDESTQKMLMSEFQKEEYNNFYIKLSNKKHMKLLPTNKKFDIKNIRKVVKKDIIHNEKELYYRDFEQNLYAIVYNSIADMYKQYFIDDFTVEFHNHKVNIKVWNHNNIYRIDFFKIYEDILRANGFRGWQEELALLRHQDMNTTIEIEFEIRKNKRYIYKDEIFENGLDNYEFINIEVL